MRRRAAAHRAPHLTSGRAASRSIARAVTGESDANPQSPRKPPWRPHTRTRPRPPTCSASSDSSGVCDGPAAHIHVERWCAQAPPRRRLRPFARLKVFRNTPTAFVEVCGAAAGGILRGMSVDAWPWYDAYLLARRCAQPTKLRWEDVRDAVLRRDPQASRPPRGHCRVIAEEQPRPKSPPTACAWRGPDTTGGSTRSSLLEDHDTIKMDEHVAPDHRAAVIIPPEGRGSTRRHPGRRPSSAWRRPIERSATEEECHDEDRRHPLGSRTMSVPTCESSAGMMAASWSGSTSSRTDHEF
jgi:hypothetical protein